MQSPELVPEKVDETHSRHKDYCYSVPSCVMTIEGSVQRRARPGTWLVEPSRILGAFLRPIHDPVYELHGATP